MRRRSSLILGVLLALTLVGSPASADPAGPTHFRSTVSATVPVGGMQGAEVDILGGDAFLVVRAAPGTEVQVSGYEGEPYLRIAGDGTVEVNTRSPARWLNDERFGAAEVEVPPQADADAPPAWEVVAGDGVYAWHDHRIHFMSPALPPSVDVAASTPQPVLEWMVPLVVDGRDVQILGELVWLPGPPVAVPVGVVLLAVAAGIAIALRWPESVPALVAVGVALTGAVGLAGSLGLPAGAEADPALMVLPGVALVALLAAWAGRRRDATRAGWLATAAVLPIAVWALLQMGVLTRPVVPHPFPAGFLRGVTSVAFGITAAAVTVSIRRLRSLTVLEPPSTESG